MCAAHSVGLRAPALLLKTLYYSRYGDIVVHPKTRVTGGRWLSLLGKLTVGKSFRVLIHPSTLVTLLRNGICEDVLAVHPLNQVPATLCGVEGARSRRDGHL
jgi:hypothetical protein